MGASQKRLATISNAAYRFQASNLRLFKTNCNETQILDRSLSLPTFYHCVGWHFYSDLSTASLGCSSSPGGRKAWICREISGRANLELALPPSLLHAPQSIACHDQQRSVREVVAAGDAPGSYGAAEPSTCSPLCLQTFLYTQKHERRGSDRQENLA